MPRLTGNSRKLGLFLKNLSTSDYIFLRMLMDMRDAIDRLRVNNKLTHEEVRVMFGLKPAEYKNFIKGNWNYDTRDMAVLNAKFYELEEAKISKREPVQVGKAHYKYQEEQPAEQAQ